MNVYAARLRRRPGCGCWSPPASCGSAWSSLLILVAGVRLRGGWLPRAVLASAVLALLGLAVANPDRLIADRNVDRFAATGRIDLAYLVALSADAVPALDRLTGHERATAHLARIAHRPDGRRRTTGAAANLGRASPELLRADPLADRPAVRTCPGSGADSPVRRETPGTLPASTRHGGAVHGPGSCWPRCSPARARPTAPAPSSTEQTPVGEALVTRPGPGPARARAAAVPGRRDRARRAAAAVRRGARGRPGEACSASTCPGCCSACCSFPFLFGVGWAYVRLAERNEQDFAAVVRRPERE